jgi:exodeoxyribonuclease VII large subunit
MHLKVRSFVELESAHLNGTKATLRALSPQGTLERGFSIVRNEKNQIVKTAANAKAGELLRIKFAEGELTTRVEKD